MNKHYVVNIDPEAQHEWDRLIVRNPISGERPDLAKIIADILGNEAGSYLIAIEIEVKILEQTTQISSKKIASKESLQQKNPTKISKLIAS